MQFDLYAQDIYLRLMTDPRLSNMFGALALSLADRIQEDASERVPRNEPAEALSLLGRSPGMTIRDLSRDIGLSHAATLRMIARLVDDGLVDRKGSVTDGRAVNLSLSIAGEAAYQTMLAERSDSISDALSILTQDERDNLGTIAEKLLCSVAVSRSNTSRMCRFCDVTACSTCPIDDVRDRLG